MNFRDGDIIFLLGAGASIDAKIPASLEMIKNIEKLIKEKDEWKKYSKLYYLIKGSIIYSENLKEVHNPNVNIEQLVNTLDELNKKDEHLLYPFIGSWSPKLSEVIGNDFDQIYSFKKLILHELSTHWIDIKNVDDIKYYSKIMDFQKEYQFPLHIFSLNYDLCIENTCKDIGIQMGFDTNKKWNWQEFENGNSNENGLFLYKLHGSINWKRNDNDELTYLDGNVDSDELQIVFGTSYKLQYIDPFLYYTYEFRRRLLTEGKLLLCVGYSFSDEHINGIISQALKMNKEKTLLVIQPTDKEEDLKKSISEKLKLNDSCIKIKNNTTKDFFENELKITTLQELFPGEDEPFEEYKQN